MIFRTLQFSFYVISALCFSLCPPLTMIWFQSQYFLILLLFVSAWNLTFLEFCYMSTCTIPSQQQAQSKRQPEKSKKKEVSVRRVEMRHTRGPLVVSSFLSCCSAASRCDIFVYIKSPNPLYDLILRLDVSRRRQCGRVCARK